MSLADTALDARCRQLAIYRSMSPEQKVEIAFAMSEEALRLTIEGIKARNSTLEGEGVRRELLRVLHGHRLANSILVASPRQ